MTIKSLEASQVKHKGHTAMKLQKLYAMILGFALISPQTNLQATKVPASQGNFSWVGSTLGTLASFSAKTLSLPFTTLSFCYRNLFAGAVLAGVAYWGYKKYAQPLWNTYKEKRKTESRELAAKVNLVCTHRSEFYKLDPRVFQNSLQKALNSNSATERVCSWLPDSWHIWLNKKYDFTRGRSAYWFVKALSEKRTIRTKTGTNYEAEDLSATNPISQHQLNILRTLRYESGSENAVKAAYQTRAASALAKKAAVVGEQELEEAGIPEENTPTAPATSSTHAAPAKVTPATA